MLIDVVLRRPVIVVGEGSEFERKVHKCLNLGALVFAITPKISEGLVALKGTGRLTVLEVELDSLEPEALPFTDLAIVAVNNKHHAREVRKVVSKRAKLLNFADMPELCDFYMPASFKRGPIEVAVSTGGMSPFMSSSIKNRLERHITELDALKVELLGRLREQLLEAIRDPKERSAIADMIVSDRKITSLLSEGRFNEALVTSLKLLSVTR